MKQQSLEAGSFEKYCKKTRKEQSLEEMEKIIPWKDLCRVITPYYPKPKGAGIKSIGIDRMLRIHFFQHWFKLSDSAAEEALYDSRSMQQFVGIDLGQEPLPDEKTILNFRHLMEKHNLGDRLFNLVNTYLAENGLKVNRGTIVDATIINAPTKNKEKSRDLDMHQTKKGNQWYFGMKVHIGVGSKTKLIFSIAITPATFIIHKYLEVYCMVMKRLWGDSAYTGQKSYCMSMPRMEKTLRRKKEVATVS